MLSPTTALLPDELLRLGYVQGENIDGETRLSRPNSADLPVQAAELAAMDLDLIVAAALPSALAVRAVAPTMPMVIGTCPGMVGIGFAQSLEHPGGNVTGMNKLPPALTGGHERQLADAKTAAAIFGISVTPYRAASLSEL